MVLIKNIQSIFVWLFLFLLPSQLGKHFFMDFSYVSGVRVDYLAPVIYFTDILFIMLMFIMRKQLLYEFRKNSHVFFATGVAVAVHFIFVQSAFLEFYASFKLFQILTLFFMFKHINIPQRLLFSSLAASAGLEVILTLTQFSTQKAVQGLFYLLGERSLSISTPGVAKASLLGEFILRPYGTFSHPNSMGGFYVLLYAFLLTLKTTSHRASVLKFVTLLLTTVLILISFSKGAILAFGIVTFLHLMWDRQEMLICRLCTFAKAIIGLSVIGLFLSSQGDLLSLEKRFFLIEQAVEIIRTHFLFGTGFGHHLYAHAEFSSPYPYFFLQPVHNIFLLFIMQAGILLSSFLGWKLWIGLRQAWKSHGKYLVLPMIVIGFTGSFDHYWITLQQNMMLAGIVFGLIFSSE